VPLTCSIITPARDEADTLPALAHALARQSIRPLRRMIVHRGSSDATVKVAEAIVAAYDWARLPATAPPERGAPIVRALHAGLDSLDIEPDVVVNVDADVTLDPDYFERLFQAFTQDPLLGIASGSAWELDDGVWRQRLVTDGTVWGATRAYRWGVSAGCV
jgi:poly-beta-1,6-N-acetyl-D-glucosamine synthase